ncbi:MAG: hypothetical protein H6661_05535 [Ardenticatenaceae bacterium]|nr:hypothetical protein [Ardenticatenaceae bacterium]
MLGSSFSSTLGTGLWTLNFATLFVMLSIWLLVRRDSAHSTTVHPLWLGSFLFAAYLARPTTAVFILLVFVYLIWQDKREVWVTAVTALAWLFLFVLYSRAEMGVWLPPYYLPQRLAGANVPLPIVFYGLFFSPGRGLFVFSPMFLLLLIVALWRWRHLRHEPLFWFALAWMGLHTWTLLRFEHWWGGASFGPRLLTDIVPAFIILTAVLRKRWPLGLGLPARRWLLGLGIVTAVFSIYVNAYAGLYVPATSLWNSMPDIDKAPQYLFDWRHPQFAATQTANCARDTDFHLQRLANHETVLAPYQPGFALPWANAAPEGTYKRDPQWYLPAARRRAAVTIPNPLGSFKIFLPVLANGAQQLGLLVGWDLSQPAGVTAVCQPAFLALRLTALEPDVPYTLHLTARSAAQQPIVIEFNGDVIDTIQPQPAYQEWHIPLAGRPFHPDSYDLFTFTTPAGAPPDLTLQAVTVSPADKADP